MYHKDPTSPKAKKKMKRELDAILLESHMVTTSVTWETLERCKKIIDDSEIAPNRTLPLYDGSILFEWGRKHVYSIMGEAKVNPDGTSYAVVQGSTNETVNKYYFSDDIKLINFLNEKRDELAYIVMR